MVVVLMTAVIAAPSFAQVLSTPEPEVVADAARLRAELEGEERLDLGTEVLVIVGEVDPAAKVKVLNAIDGVIDDAYDAYTALNAPAALAKIAEARAKLGLMVDSKEARELLAEAMRIKGLVFLFMEKPDQAATAFFSSYLLEPDFVPDSQEWPPEARLAFADAIAAARRDPGGILSVDMAPTSATLWLNGRKAGIGPTTLSGLPPGEHVVLATCAGFNRVTAVVTVESGGKLSQAALYLEAQPPEVARQERAAAFRSAFGHDGEAYAARFLAEHLGAEHLIYVTKHAGARAAWVLDASGARHRDPVVVVAGNDAAREIRIAILGEEPTIDPLKAPIPEPPDLGPTEWYKRWEVWMVMGAAVAVAGGTAVYIGVSQSQNEDVTIYMGGY